ncbi:hypothetical protein [Elizabethkingia bruuniana]|uniref:hypothetical protein n=1 Tax=Elizabethkingia bruuniana TaxID=1756149 RepID=UPI00398C38B7
MSDNLTANDLRVGSSYYLNETEVKLDERLLFAMFNNPLAYGLQNYTPIPLTEERLLKFGFQKEFESDVAIFYENDFLSINIYKGYNSTFLKRNRLIDQQDYSINNIKYVHQLQSLYYMLTQRELL